MRCFACLMLTLVLAVPAWAEDTATKEPIEALKPVPRDGWWVKRHEEKLQAIKGAEKIDVVFIGDSITHGWEGAGKKIWDENFASWSPLNLGYGGDRTEHVLWRFEHGELDGYNPKVAVIMIGTNNTGHRKEKSEDTAAGVKAIVEKLHEKHPETKVLLLAIFPRGAKTEDQLRQLNDGANAIIEKSMKDKDYVTFLNINDVFLTEDGTLPKEIMPDLLHPKEKGYQLWAEAVTPKIKELVGEQSLNMTRDIKKAGMTPIIPAFFRGASGIPFDGPRETGHDEAPTGSFLDGVPAHASRCISARSRSICPNCHCRRTILWR